MPLQGNVSDTIIIRDGVLESKRAKIQIQPTLGFSDEDKAGTIQPHDDALVVTLKIGGYGMRRMLVD